MDKYISKFKLGNVRILEDGEMIRLRNVEG